MVIRKYHLDRDEANRNICLIPSSAHGTNPASAQMAGMKVVVVNCDKEGNVDFDDLKKKAEQHSENLGALMVTCLLYTSPSPRDKRQSRMPSSA